MSCQRGTLATHLVLLLVEMYDEERGRGTKRGERWWETRSLAPRRSIYKR